MLRCAALLHGIKIGGDDYEHASVLNPKVEGTAVDPGLGDGPAGDRVGDPTSRRPAAGGLNLGISVICPARIAASGSNSVLLFAEERDRRPGGTRAIRCALRALADRT